MNHRYFITSFKFLMVFALSSASLVSASYAQALDSTVTAEELKVLDEVLRSSPEIEGAEIDYGTHPLDEHAFMTNKKPRVVAMQLGIGGNPDVDGKLYREKSWLVSILYPVKVTRIGNVPTTIYVEARCASLGQQPESAYTDNINVRCGPGVVSDSKVANWLSLYARMGLVTSRFSHNGAPRGQMNVKTGKEFRAYPNDTWFTGAAMGTGVKIKVLKDTKVFAEYTKYYVQQTDNKAYQYRGGFNFGIAKNFWLFQRPKE